jgi:N,N'-diacetylchitobiose phosphorylase
MPQFFDPHGPESSLHRLTKGPLEVLISDSGAGQLRWNGLALTRRHADPVEDDLGSLLYVRDLDSGAIWSLGYQPTRVEPQVYRVGCQDACFRLEREDQGIALRLDLSLDAAKDLERRRLRLTNVSDRARRIELTSYLEVALFPDEADAAHPAFAKLFVQTERDASTGALLARRRPRGQGESWPWMIHALLDAEAVQWETDRARFIGRGRNRARPAALFGSHSDAGSLSGSLGNVLDPMLALRTVVELEPGADTELTWVTGAAPDRAAALALLDGESLKASVSSVADDETPAGREADTEPLESTQDLRFFNGYGGFSSDGRQYEIRLPYQGAAGHRRPPQPWINVIANPDFGCLVSESGAGYTWSRNSQANRLTPWSNDPVSDPHGEALYVRDEATGESWSPLPGPRPAPADYRVTHGLGFTRFSLRYDDRLEQEATLFVPRHDPVRILRLRLTNSGTSTRHLSLFGYQRLVMGQQPSSSSAIVTAIEPEAGLLRAIDPQRGRLRRRHRLRHRDRLGHGHGQRARFHYRSSVGHRTSSRSRRPWPLSRDVGSTDARVLGWIPASRNDSGESAAGRDRWSATGCWARR